MKYFISVFLSLFLLSCHSGVENKRDYKIEFNTSTGMDVKNNIKVDTNYIEKLNFEISEKDNYFSSKSYTPKPRVRSIKKESIEVLNEPDKLNNDSFLDTLIPFSKIILDTNEFLKKDIKLPNKIVDKLPTIDRVINNEFIGVTFDLENLYFMGDSEKLKDESIPTLERLYNFMLKNSDVCIQINGHINYEGVLDSNTLDWRLSEFRARSVYDFLIRKDIQYWRLSYKGYGNSKMKILSPKTEQEAEQNRRVEIKIVGFGRPN